MQFIKKVPLINIIHYFPTKEHHEFKCSPNANKRKSVKHITRLLVGDARRQSANFILVIPDDLGLSARVNFT